MPVKSWGNDRPFCLLLLFVLSFIAVVDMDDREAVDLANQNKCEPIFVWQLHKDNPKAKRYIFYHASDEAFGKLKTAGCWKDEP